MLIPMVVESSNRGERSWDIFSRILKDRIVFLGTAIDDTVANSIIAQLLFLESESNEQPISLYVQSPGGMVSAGLAIIDTIHLIKAPVSTLCIGQACSMGAVILAAGEKGQRFMLPHARSMLHQPSGGSEGKASDILIQAGEIAKCRSTLNTLLAEYTGQPLEKIEKDVDRDFFMSAQESVDYGLVDAIMTRKV
jgi:ATP-dependent Clp protease, protease subunit